MGDTKEIYDNYRNLEIGPDLDRALETQAASFLYVAELAVQADTEFERIRDYLGQLTAKVDGDIREKALSEGRKLTEGGISGEIDRNADIIKTKVALLNLRRNRDILKALKESWYMRKDCLIQRCIKERAEMESFRASSSSVKEA